MAPTTALITEEIRVSSENLPERVRELINGGGATRITINNLEGHLMLEIPVSTGIAGMMLAPVISLDIASVAVYEGEYIIAVTRKTETPADNVAPEPATDAKTNLV